MRKKRRSNEKSKAAKDPNSRLRQALAEDGNVNMKTKNDGWWYDEKRYHDEKGGKIPPQLKKFVMAKKSRNEGIMKKAKAKIKKL